MKKMLIILLSIFISGAYSENNSAATLEIIPKIGVLGYELKIPLTIEGIKQIRNPKKKIHARMILIDTVNSEKLEKPIPLHIKNVNTDILEAGTRCVFEGYQSGEWVGCDGCTAPRHFMHYFIVTFIVSPKSVKIEKLISSQSS